jgi:hypothetical protein
MNIILSLILAIGVALAIWLIVWHFLSVLYSGPDTPAPPSNAVALLAGSSPGTTTVTSKDDMIRSYNQENGLTFSYSCWFVVNDYTVNYGTKRAIFTKDDCPGVYLDTTSNSILVAINTFGAKETILIDNMPAKKWIHLALVVDQDSVDIYIDAILKQHHSLAQLPKQNTSPVKIGSTWDGVISQLYYYPLALTLADIQGLAGKVPSDDLQKRPSSPPYFHPTWFTGRLTSQ